MDPFDFSECLREACEAFHGIQRAGGVARASVSGGTKILADATLVAAFQEGVEAWYFTPEPVRLPVLRGVRIVDALDAAERALVRALRKPVPADALLRIAAGEGVPRGAAVRGLRRLREHGLFTETLESGRAWVRPTTALETYRAHLGGEGTGKG